MVATQKIQVGLKRYIAREVYPLLTSPGDCGTVIAAQPAAVTPNFDAILLGYGDERVAALRHALLNVRAGAVPASAGIVTSTARA